MEPSFKLGKIQLEYVVHNRTTSPILDTQVAATPL